MEEKHQFIIKKYCPTEEIFTGRMTFTEARRFMDENATFERRVGFQVFNDVANRWEDFGDSYHGGRKVYDKAGCLFIIDPDYRNMWKPENQRWHLWRDYQGKRKFIQSFTTEEQARHRRDFLQVGCDEYKYIVEPSDIDITIESR